MTRETNGRTGRGISRRKLLQTTGLATAGMTLGVGTAAGSRTGFGVSKDDYTISSWDGTDLTATLYTPDENGPHPAVLMTHGWGSLRQSPLTAGKALYYAKNGYTVLAYDSRGFGGSGGISELNGPPETKDAQRLVDWLANRPEVALEATGNPKVGMDGISYAGGIQFQAAAADDRIDAIVPRITWNDLRYSLAPNGVIKSLWLTILLGAGEIGSSLDFDSDTGVTDDLGEWYRETFWDNEVPDDAIQAFEDRSVAYKDDFDTPAFLVQAWDDALFNTLEALWTYRKLQDDGVDTRLTFYEGGHAPEEITVPLDQREYMNNLAVKWMDKHVRGESASVPQTSSYLKQRGEFRTDPQWPPADVSKQPYELSNADRDGDNTIEQWSWWYDTEVTYKWTIPDDIEIVGTPTFDLTFDVDGPEARVFFNLEQNGEFINNVGEGYRIEGSGTQRIKFPYPTLQRYFSAGDELGLQMSVSKGFYLNSRDSDGVTVRPSDSRILIPQRDQ